VRGQLLFFCRIQKRAYAWSCINKGASAVGVVCANQELVTNSIGGLGIALDKDLLNGISQCAAGLELVIWRALDRVLVSYSQRHKANPTEQESWVKSPPCFLWIGQNLRAGSTRWCYPWSRQWHRTRSHIDLYRICRSSCGGGQRPPSQRRRWHCWRNHHMPGRCGHSGRPMTQR